MDYHDIIKGHSLAGMAFFVIKDKTTNNLKTTHKNIAAAAVIILVNSPT